MLRMADVELTSVDWLWFPYIPFGKLTIIQGNPGEGKTYFAMRLAAACTNRKPLPLSLIHIFDSGKPFAIVLPLNVGNICFYDTNGNVVEYLRQQL